MTADLGAFSRWIAREILPHEAGLRAWLRRVVTDAGDAEDIIQECYCQLSELPDVTTIAHPRAYLFRMARNLVLQELRRARIVRIEVTSEIDRFDIASDVPSPERVAAGRSELALVRRLIADLPARTRQIVELRKIHRLSQQEIAARLGVSVNVVENEASRGLRTILARLAGEGAAGDGLAQDDRDARNRRRH